jgi:hypothetical protein
MLGDRRAADREPARDLSDGERPVGEALEDRAPGGIAECGQAVSSVSRH